MRLTVRAAGQVTLETAPLPPSRPTWQARIHPTPLDPTNPWLSVKTSQRQLYDTARADLPQGTDEWFFLNQLGDLCEGTITNIFIKTDDIFLTPNLSCGVLPGVLRQNLIENGTALEAKITLSDALDPTVRVFAGNSLRGLVPIQSIACGTVPSAKGATTRICATGPPPLR